MPDVQGIIDESAGADCWCLFDMKSGFYNIEVVEAARECMGIVTQDGLYRYLRMPFGLLAAPLWFQYVVDTLLDRARVAAAKAFVDDLTVRGRVAAWRRLWDDSMRVLRVVTAAGFMINLRKCQFLTPRATILGYDLWAEGYRLADKYLKGWVELDVPRTLRDLQVVLGRLLWASPFIPHFKRLVAPIE